MFVWFPLFVFPNIPLSATKSEENLIRYASNHIKSYQIVSIDDLDRRYQYSTLSSTEVLPWQETFTQTHKETWFRAGVVRYRGWARRAPGTRYEVPGSLQTCIIQAQTSQNKPEAANTIPDLLIQAQPYKCKPKRATPSPDLQLQAQGCKYKPRHLNTSPAVQIQTQTCKSNPRLATSPDLQIQAQTCKYKPDVQTHAQTWKYMPRLANTSQDLRIQATPQILA